MGILTRKGVSEMSTTATILDTIPGQMPWPGEAYDAHDPVLNEFGTCLGCGLDLHALCHPAATVGRGPTD